VLGGDVSSIRISAVYNKAGLNRALPLGFAARSVCVGSTSRDLPPAEMNPKREACQGPRIGAQDVATPLSALTALTYRGAPGALHRVVRWNRRTLRRSPFARSFSGFVLGQAAGMQRA